MPILIVKTECDLDDYWFNFVSPTFLNEIPVNKLYIKSDKMKSDSVNIYVAVRVRPLNNNETQQNECVSINNNTITVKDMKHNTSS